MRADTPWREPVGEDVLLVFMNKISEFIDFWAQLIANTHGCRSGRRPRLWRQESEALARKIALAVNKSDV